MPYREKNIDGLRHEVEEKLGLGPIVKKANPGDEYFVKVHSSHHFLKVVQIDAIICFEHVEGQYRSILPRSPNILHEAQEVAGR